MALNVLRQCIDLGGRRPFTVGLGDAANDLSFLRIVDRPIVIPRPNGLDPALSSALPHAERAPHPGPRGWNAAILALLAGRLLPRVSKRRR
jgi:mannosyl-3-phosphoglycerate phosphatase